MAKIAILTVGYSKFALPAKANVGAILAVLSQAEPVEYDYIGDQKLYFPETSRHRGEISVDYIDEKQLRAEKPRRPAAAPEVVVTPALNGSRRLALPGGQP